MEPTRLLCPWDAPGKNAGVGCHFLLPQWSLLICLFGKFERFALFEASDTLGLFLKLLFALPHVALSSLGFPSLGLLCLNSFSPYFLRKVFPRVLPFVPLFLCLLVLSAL